MCRGHDPLFSGQSTLPSLPIYHQCAAHVPSGDDTCSSDKLKTLNWEVVEYTNLLQQALNFDFCYRQAISTQVNNVLKPDLRTYLRNLYKKRRSPAATHVMVIMMSEEQRKAKPYALPVQYIPYKSIKNTEVRVFTSKIKKMSRWTWNV